MKKFNKNFVVNKTQVKVEGLEGFHLVTEIHENKRWIKIKGFAGFWQRDHVFNFTNKETIK